MENRYYLAIDIGASSGRHILAHKKDGHCPEGARIGIKIDPDGIHVMKKSAYSGMFGDYSSFSEEYDELDDATLSSDEEESGDEE